MRKASLLRDFQGFLAARAPGHSCRIVETQASGHASKLAREAELSGCTDLVVVGGDGTLHEAANGLQGTGIALSLLAAGTGNDFAKGLGWPRRLPEQYGAIVGGASRLIDVGLCNGTRFVNTMGLGFDGHVVEHLARTGKQFGGHLSYLAATLRLLAGFREPWVSGSFDGEAFACPVFMLAVNNGTTFGGGFRITPEARLDDGLLDVCLIRALGGWERLLHLPKVQAGRHAQVRQVSFRQVREVRFEAGEGIYGQLDGERLGGPPFAVSALPQALRVIGAGQSR
jgi:diacylglycerol kinase (ATP)